MESSLTKQDIFEVVSQVVEKNNEEIFEHINQSFTEVEQRFGQIDRRFEQIDKRFEQIDRRFEQIDRRFDKIDEQFAAFRGDLISMLRMEDTKVVTLTNKLGIRQVLPTADVAEVLAMEPFPKSV